MIITIARESGSGGYTVGKLLSDYYHIPVHDQDSLARLAKEKGMYDEMPDFFQESPVNSIIYALSMDFRNKKFTEPERDRLEHLLPEKDFILVGRCGNYIFRNHTGCISVFIHGDIDHRIRYKADMLGISPKRRRRSSIPMMRIASPITATTPARHGGLPKTMTSPSIPPASATLSLPN